MNFELVQKIGGRLPIPLLRAVSGLLLWAGFLAVVQAPAFAAVTALRWYSHDPKMAHWAKTPQIFIAWSFVWALLGVLLIFGGFRLEKVAALRIPGAETLQSRVFDFLSYVFKPRPGDALNEWRIDFDGPVEEVKEKVSGLPKVLLVPFIGGLWADRRQPAVLMAGGRLWVENRGGKLPRWEGVLSEDEAGHAFLEGQVSLALPPLRWYYAVFGYCWNVFIFLIAFYALPSGRKGLVIYPVLAFFYMFYQWYSRSQRWYLHREEKLFEIFFRERLGATAIYLKPRYEIFSVEWFKNLVLNR